MTPSDPQVERFAALVEQEVGLRFAERDRAMLGEVLVRRAHARGERVSAYLRELESPTVRRQELRALAPSLTVGESYFFRNPSQFDAFMEVVLPDRLRGRGVDERVEVLSAGCSSGEELYTLAILLQEKPLLGARVDLLGVDLNGEAVSTARRGRYSAWSLRDMPAEVREQWLRADGKVFEVDERLRERVTFEERNLLDPDPSFWRPGRFDVVFFRNVSIYFGPETIRTLLDRLWEALAPGGYLFLGDAEANRIHRSSRFQSCQSHGTWYYRRVEPQAVVEPAPPPRRTARAAAARTRSERPPRRTPASPAVPVTPAPRRGAHAHYLARERALELLRLERFAEGLLALEEVPEAERGAELRLLRAALLTATGRTAEAESTCQELLAREAPDAGAHLLLGLCREAAGDAAGARRHHEAALFLQPDFALAHLHLGRLSRRAGDLDTARRALSRAARLLETEDPGRLVLFGGGFHRSALLELCRAELRACEVPR
jgi:chemotaxis protein methyltransferase CheR